MVLHPSESNAGRLRARVALAWLAAAAVGCSEGASVSPAPAPAVETGTATAPPAQAAAVSGRVLDLAGQPVARFHLRALQVDRPNFPPSGEALEVEGSADGAFALAGLTPGRLVLEATAPGFAASFSAPLTATAGGALTDVLVRLGRGGTVTGRVIDAHSADPIAGAEVLLFDAMEAFDAPASTSRPRTRTDAQGRFTLEHVPAGDGSLRVESAGHASLVLGDVAVAEGGTRELPLLALALGATVAGIVRGPDGAPLPGAVVRLAPGEADPLLEPRTTCCDAAGRFLLEHVVPGVYQLSAAHAATGQAHPPAGPSEHGAQVEVVAAEQQSHEYELRLARRAR